MALQKSVSIYVFQSATMMIEMNQELSILLVYCQNSKVITNLPTSCDAIASK